MKKIIAFTILLSVAFSILSIEKVSVNAVDSIEFSSNENISVILRNGLLTISNNGIVDENIILKENNININDVITIVFKDNITEIRNFKFSDYKNLKKIIFESSLNNIDYNMFENCNNITIECKCDNSSLISYCEKNTLKYEVNHEFEKCVLCDDKPCGPYVVKYTCKNCGETHIVESDRFHKWVTKKKSATYFSKGYIKIKCEVCGKSNKKVIKKKILKKPKVKFTAGNKKINVKYTKVKDATGFQVRYRTGNKKWTIKNYNTKKSICKSIKNLKHKKKYKVQVRSYISNKKVKAYSAWTKSRTIRVK